MTLNSRDTPVVGVRGSVHTGAEGLRAESLTPAILDLDEGWPGRNTSLDLAL